MVQQRLDALRCLSDAEDLAAYRLHLSTCTSLGGNAFQPGACRMINWPYKMSSALARGLVLSVNDITAVLQSHTLLGGLAFLMTELESVMRLSLGPQPEACSRSPVAVQLAKVVAESGLLPALAAFCQSIASALQQAAAQHKQVKTAVMTLLSVVFGWWLNLTEWWPGRLLVGSRGLAVTVLPMALLVVSTFRNTAVLCSPATAVDAAASSSPDADTPFRRAKYTACGLLMRCYGEALHSCRDPLSAAAAMHVLTDKVWQDAVHIALAAAVTELSVACPMEDSDNLHSQQEQQQQLQTEAAAFHDELWADLGCPAASSHLQAALRRAPDNGVEQVVSLAVSTCLNIAESLTMKKSTAVAEDQPAGLMSKQTDTPQGQPQQQQEVSISRAQALLKVSIELLLLLPCASGPKHMLQALQASRLLQCITARVMPSEELVTLSRSLLAPVFKAALKVQQALDTLAGESTTMSIQGNEVETADVISETRLMCCELVLSTVYACARDAEPLLPAVNVTPDRFLRSLQTLLRCQASLEDPPGAETRMEILLTVACRVVWDISPSYYSVAAFPAAHLAPAGTPAAARQQPLDLEETMLSVLLTCLKLANKCTPGGLASTMCFRLAVLVLLTAKEVSDTMYWPTCSSSSSSSRTDDSGISISSANCVSHLASSWLMLVGRSFATAGRCFATGRLSQPLPNASAEYGDVDALIKGLQWLDDRLLPLLVGKAAVHDDLQEQLAVLQHLLRSTLVQGSKLVNSGAQPQASSISMASTSGDGSAAGFPLTERILSKLQQFGEAVCAALPVPACCNNPGCFNFKGESEQQLVRGKSCVCGGCEVARYCGRDCQTAHWTQHKAACRDIKKARQKA